MLRAAGPSWYPSLSESDIAEEFARPVEYELLRLREIPKLVQLFSVGDTPMLSEAPIDVWPLPTLVVSPVGSVNPNERPTDGDHSPGSSCAGT